MQFPCFHCGHLPDPELGRNLGHERQECTAARRRSASHWQRPRRWRRGAPCIDLSKHNNAKPSSIKCSKVKSESNSIQSDSYVITSHASLHLVQPAMTNVYGKPYSETLMIIGSQPAGTKIRFMFARHSAYMKYQFDIVRQPRGNVQVSGTSRVPPVHTRMRLPS